MMEPVRGTAPEAGFLEGVRNLANQFKVVLIFDEVTSGFRLNNGGVHMIYDVYPDLCVFGKALGNGFPISAVIGTGDVMSAAQSTFISSTFWTERVGFTAAIATLEKFAALKVWEHLQAAGEKVNEAWSDAATKTGVKIKISGIAPLTRIDFVSDYPALLQTLYTQEMLRRGYLAGSSIYSSYAYDDELLLSLPNVFEEVFTEIKAADEGDGCERALISEIKHTGFQRLT
jgi:glutamate-1-semialdehyde aminotransferase